MGLRKGMSNNRKGRPPGSANKNLQDMRQWLQDFLDGNRKTIEADWKKLDPQQRILLFEKLLKFTLPTLQSVDQTIDINALPDQKIDELFNRIISPK